MRANGLGSSWEGSKPVWAKPAERLPKRPKVFFEEWDEPLISGIGWVSELVEIAGGIDIFADRRDQGAAKDRVVTVEEVVAREPDLIIGSWCGKKFRPRAGDDAGWLRASRGCAAPGSLRNEIVLDLAARARRNRRPFGASKNY
jgi:iron complex transport system substrate-binding protein